MEVYFATKSVGSPHSATIQKGLSREKSSQQTHNPQTIEALKANIRQKIRRIPLDMCDRVITNFNVRVATVIQRRGTWIEHVINY